MSPYPGIPAELTGKMEKCVAEVMGKGHDKSSAIAICESSIMGKEFHMSDEVEFKETWTTAFMNDLPDSSFLFIEAGGKKDESGKTEPRSLRHFPYKDAGGKIDLPHLRDAIGRIPQSNASGLNKDAVQARARKLLADQSAKKEARSEALKVALKQFDPDYSQAESWDVVTASAALSQLAQLAGGEADQNEPDHVAMLGKIMTALTKFINEEIDEMVNAQEEPGEAPEPDEVAGGPAMMEAKPAGIVERIKALFKQGARHNMSDQKMIQTIHDHASALGADCSMQVKQMADGAWRWVLLSSNAYRDKDKEIVSTKALEDDCLRADADGYYGPLRWWHVGEYDLTTKQAGPGADLGMCDFNAMHGRILIESGTFKNEAIARAVQKAAANLESSIGFFHPLTEPDGEGTYKSIRRFERSLLPKGKAANPLTALTVITKETQTMQKEKLEGLKALVGEAEAASIVNQAEVVQKAADAAGLSFKAQADAPETPAEPITADSLKEMTDTLAASLAPVIEAKVKEQVEAALKAYTVTAETKAAGQQAQIDKLTASLKELIGDLPRNASRGVVAIDSDHNIVSDAKTKEFDPENVQAKAPLQDFANWLVTGKMAA